MKNIHDVLDLCLKVSESKRLDCFFEFAGHVNLLSVRVHLDEKYLGEEDNSCILMNNRITIDNCCTDANCEINNPECAIDSIYNEISQAYAKYGDDNGTN